MSDGKNTGLRASAFAALALAFSSVGDASLYPYLPLNSHTVGVPALWVGLILSINRFVRIISNTFMVHAFSKYGLRPIMIVAVLVAITSTLGYGLATGMIAWILLRIMWGLAFSAMRVGGLGYALQYPRRGLAFGVSRALQEMGPMLSLFLTPALLKYLDFKTTFYFLSVLSLPAFYFAWNLPVNDDRTQMIKSARLLRFPTTLNSITFVLAIMIDGIIVVVLGLLFLHYGDIMNLVTATTMAAFYLGYRRLCLVTLSVFGGWVSDNVGIENIFNISVVLVVVGLIAIVCGWVGTGAVIVFTFYSINSAITPGAAIGTGHSLGAMAENATWRDIGAATGTLLGGVLLSFQHLNFVLTMGCFIVVSLLIVHLAATGWTFKLFSLWK